MDILRDAVYSRKLCYDMRNRFRYNIIEYHNTNTQSDTTMFYDANGNLALLWECEKDFTRFHDWDDENRLRMVVDNNKAGYYGYDANGERVYKLTGTSSITPPNHIESFASVHLNDAVLYPNPYVVVTEKNYTKHYYAGGERLATVIGNGGWCTMSPDVISVTPTEHEYNLQKYWGDIYQSEYPFEYPHEPQPVLTPNVDIDNNALPELQYRCPLRHLNQLSISYSHDILLTAIRNFCEAHGAEEDIFYTHGDHLGSANWITDYKGMPVQYLHYLPYGQLLANQQATSTYDERFKFTGKERDAETGYDYFGARYYWSLLKHWTTVDPLVDNYLHISPYAYCNWNPIKYVDPDGKFPVLPVGLSYYITAKVLENTPSHGYVRMAGYTMQHPLNALIVGPYIDGWSYNISSIAGNFEINLMRAAGLSYLEEGDEGNAYRHTLWQAMITNILGEESATRIGNAHEYNSSYDVGKTSGLTESEFDTAIDLRNNEIGRCIGAKNKGASNKKLALLVLKEFRKNGLWVGTKQADGTYSIQKKRITQEQYDSALKELNKKGENGKDVGVE